MDTIWKFELKLDQIVMMPVGSEIIKAGAQGESIFIWAIVNTEAKKEHRRFKVVPTGGAIFRSDLVFLDTVFIGPYVFHVFEEGN